MKMTVKGMASIRVKWLQCELQLNTEKVSVTSTVCNVRCDTLPIVFTEAVNESRPYAVVCFDDAIGVAPWNHVTMVDSMDGSEKCSFVEQQDEL